MALDEWNRWFCNRLPIKSCKLVALKIFHQLKVRSGNMSLKVNWRWLRLCLRRAPYNSKYCILKNAFSLVEMRFQVHCCYRFSEDEACFEEIKSLPGQYRVGLSYLVKHLQPMVDNGLKTILVFPVLKDSSKVCKLVEKNDFS